MAESRTLSQAEIDALLNQIPEGGAEATEQVGTTHAPQAERPFARVIRAYDFRRPDKFSKEQWHTLQSMHESFARQVGATFSSRLRALVTVRLSSIEQGLYEEWQAQVPSETVCYVLAMAPLDGNLVLEMSTDIAAEVIDRLLGGNGLLINRERELGEIELTLLRSFAVSLISPLEDMWAAITPAQIELKDIGLDASLIQVAGPNDVVVTALFEVSIGTQLGAMSICVPYTVLEPIASSLSTRVWQQSSKRAGRNPGTRRALQALLRHAPLDVVVEVASAEVPVSTLAEMTVGDTLLLDRRLDQPLPVLIGGRPRFLARPGLVGKHSAARIVDVVVQEGADYVDEPEPEAAPFVPTPPSASISVPAPTVIGAPSNPADPGASLFSLEVAAGA